MGAFQHALIPHAARTETGGLDVLAMAVAYQSPGLLE